MRVVTLTEDELRQIQIDTGQELFRLLTGWQTQDWRKTRKYTLEDMVTQFPEFEYLKRGKEIKKTVNTEYYMKKLRAAAKDGKLGEFDRWGNITVTYDQMVKFLFNK